jgi:glycosyltransferase involved in cell wall biosynthesis
MGRVAWHWQRALGARGFDLVHIGPAAIGRPVHPALFPFAAYRCYTRLGLKPAAILVHEPAGLPFTMTQRRVIAFSHGLERRCWKTTLALSSQPEFRVRRRSRLLYPIWRLAPADYTLAHARALLVLNTDDLACVQRRYHRSAEDVFLFRNGVNPYSAKRPVGSVAATVLFVGSWLPRKGTATLVAAARLLDERGIRPNFVLAGTGLAAGQVLADWPENLRHTVQILPRFVADDETDLYSHADILVLPSIYEGQPLALLQAMAEGCCCIASDIAGNRDLIDHGDTGLLHPVGNAKLLAEFLADCLARPLMRQRIGENARNATAGRSWEVVAAEVVDFVERIISRAGASSEPALY